MVGRCVLLVNFFLRGETNKMPKVTLQTLGRKLVEKRGTRGIREVAKEIGISPATLSRVERGHLPDLETFGKVCRWLDVDPGQVLGVTSAVSATPRAAVHFKKDRALHPKTAQALAQMILAAQRALMASEGA
jgi:transcriptional regulator with XRE-family HTH domain